jgi:hypothetical protein
VVKQRMPKQQGPDGPVSLGALLERSRRLTRATSVPWSVWREAVGAHVARRSRPSSLTDSTLFVTVTSSSWAQELSFLSRSIIERLARAGYRVTELRFSVGTVQLPERASRTQKVRRRALPEGLAERLARIEDPRLCELIAHAASYDPERD